MDKSESIKELATALAKAQSEMGNAKKSSENPYFKSKYADLAEVLDTVKPLLSKHGLSVVQMPGYEGPQVTVTTVLMHSSGEYISEVAKVTPVKPDPQSIGSAITYLRRYALASFAGIAQEDDDANTHVQAPQQAAKSPQRPIPAPKSGPEFAYRIPFDESKRLNPKSFGLKWDSAAKVWRGKEVVDLNMYLDMTASVPATTTINDDFDPNVYEGAY
jgi:hypothetical protein